jgi:hypothetical protein
MASSEQGRPLSLYIKRKIVVKRYSRCVHCIMAKQMRKEKIGEETIYEEELIPDHRKFFELNGEHIEKNLELTSSHPSFRAPGEDQQGYVCPPRCTCDSLDLAEKHMHRRFTVKATIKEDQREPLYWEIFGVNYSDYHSEGGYANQRRKYYKDQADAEKAQIEAQKKVDAKKALIEAQKRADSEKARAKAAKLAEIKKTIKSFGDELADIRQKMLDVLHSQEHVVVMEVSIPSEKKNVEDDSYLWLDD